MIEIYNNSLFLFYFYFLSNFEIFSGGYEDKYTLGNGNVETKFFDDIVEFDIINETWTQVNKMVEKRWKHALGIVDFSDFENYCTVV